MSYLDCFVSENKSYGSKKPFCIHSLMYTRVASGTVSNPPPLQQSTETARYSFKGHKKLKKYIRKRKKAEGPVGVRVGQGQVF
jgi:hypothetical protein